LVYLLNPRLSLMAMKTTHSAKSNLKKYLKKNWFPELFFP
jgi:hypothetical protein